VKGSSPTELADGVFGLVLCLLCALGEEPSLDLKSAVAVMAVEQLRTSLLAGRCLRRDDAGRLSLGSSWLLRDLEQLSAICGSRA